ncbi:MAG: alpha-L-arabinofuranosidase C-terminal domain-containing protein, partial [Rhodothermales bacterium]
NMTPEHYTDVYKRFATFLRPFGGVRPYRVATGAAGSDYNWTEVMMREAGSMIDGLDLHHYTLVGSWAKKGHATDFGEAEWFELMSKATEIKTLVERHGAIMDRYDPEKRVDLIVGEWGVWHEVEEGTNPGFLYQQNTIRDALVASYHLDVFNNHADRVKGANIAQTVNVLQAMLLTKGPDVVLTPTYHVFEFYTVHHDATLLPIALEPGTYSYGDESIPAVSASASRNEEGTIHLTLTNVDPHRDRVIDVDLHGAAVGRVDGRILTADAINAHNTFEWPETVVPAAFEGASLTGGGLQVVLPAKSVVVLALRL